QGKASLKKEFSRIPIPSGWELVSDQSLPKGAFDSCLQHPDLPCPGVSYIYKLTKETNNWSTSLPDQFNNMLAAMATNGYAQAGKCLEDSCSSNKISYYITMRKGRLVVRASAFVDGGTPYVTVGIGKD
ncbi:MAG TPA: hypothetical protein VIJ25_00405, partial [Methylococcales bacterium]